MKDIIKSLELKYTSGDFRGALDVLLENKYSFDKPIFHYNMGTIFSKLQQYGASRYHLEKAIAEGFSAPMAYNNLKFVKTKLNVKDISNSKEIIDIITNKLVSIPQPLFSTLSIVSMVILSILAIKKKINMILVVLLILVSFIPYLLNIFFVSNINYAVALYNVSVYEGPSEVFSQNKVIKEGSKFIIGKRKENWYYVERPTKFSGWVEKSKLGVF